MAGARVDALLAALVPGRKLAFGGGSGSGGLCRVPAACKEIILFVRQSEGTRPLAACRQGRVLLEA